MRMFILVSVLLLITGCAGPYAKFDEPLAISSADLQKLNATRPINKKLAAVKFDRNKVEVCLMCLKNYGWRQNFGNYWENLFDKDFPSLLKTVLDRSAIFDRQAKDAITLKAQLISFDSQAEAGWARKQLTVLYQLMDGNSVIQTWRIRSSGHANHFSGMDNEAESSHEAITQNILMFTLVLMADALPDDSERIKQEIAALNQKMNTDNASIGNIFGLGFGGAFKGVKAVGGAVGSAISFVGENSGAIADGLHSTAAQMERSNREYNQAYGQAVLGSRLQSTESPALSSAARMETGSETSASASTNRVRENGNGSVPVKKKRIRVDFAFVDNPGTMAATSALAIEQSYAKVKRQAEKWVAERMNGSASANAVITSFREKDCIALGGNPLYRKCTVEFTYEADNPY